MYSPKSECSVLEVEEIKRSLFGLSFEWKTYYLCEKDRVKYDRIDRLGRHLRFLGWVESDENGKIIGIDQTD